MIKYNNFRRSSFGAALLLSSILLLSGCGGANSSQTDAKDSSSAVSQTAEQDPAQSQSQTPAETSDSEEISAPPSAGDNSGAEEANGFFDIWQKYSSGELDTVPFEDLADAKNQYGIVSLAEETESGLKLYGYLTPEHLYEGIYLLDSQNRVNGFPSTVYADSTYTKPSMEWSAQDRILKITVSREINGASESQVLSFQVTENGPIVSLDEEEEESSEESGSGLTYEFSEEENNAFIAQSGMSLQDAGEGVIQLLDALESGSRETVAGMIQFPRKLTVPSGVYTVNSAEEFLPYYDEIFTEAFISQLLETELSLFAHDGLISFGTGQIWFTPATETEPMQITTVNGLDDSSLRYDGPSGVQPG